MPAKRTSPTDKISFHATHQLRDEAERIADQRDLTLAQVCRSALRRELAESQKSLIVSKGDDAA